MVTLQSFLAALQIAVEDAFDFDGEVVSDVSAVGSEAVLLVTPSDGSTFRVTADKVS